MARVARTLTPEERQVRKQLRMAARTLFDLLDHYADDGLDNRWVQGQIKAQWRRYKELAATDQIFRQGRRGGR